MKRSWHFVIPVLMIILLMISAVGVVCHHHDSNTAVNCTLCHLALEPAAGGAGQGGFVVECNAVFSPLETPLSGLRAVTIPQRAPPA